MTEDVSDPTKSNLKKEVSQLYNKINKEVHGLGVKKQKIETFNNTVVIFSEHKRNPSLNALNNEYKELTLAADAALIKEFKGRLKLEIERHLGIGVFTVLKDFDPDSEYACTVIHFNEDF
ncbi:Na-translocating system protein MpsC family protein [Natribacillus halophilus]|uniref:Uncharacterized protein YbcI n=1 Tax=Natribacillus halophilus TaxID=549003 RepID=A0A1G8N0U4_9BACI|nr:Na-translocating system protein MpsC family protein [Natribacillus halophilus]SDI73792.1 Uncharacterized protein YbcI [Natribacillus halophilus]